MHIYIYMALKNSTGLRMHKKQDKNYVFVIKKLLLQSYHNQDDRGPSRLPQWYNVNRHCTTEEGDMIADNLGCAMIVVIKIC